MEPRQQIQNHVRDMLNQGYSPQQVHDSLINSGWDRSVVANAISTQSISLYIPHKKKGRRIIIAALVFGILAAIVAGAYIVWQKELSNDTQKTNTVNTESKNIITTPDMKNYVQFTDLRVITFLLSKQWSGEVYRPQSALVTLFNYDPDAVTAELKSDGRYPSNANFYHDIPRRDLRTYPFSLDKTYEVQISATSMIINEPLTREAIDGLGEDNIRDLQFYKVNDQLVADYIQVGDGNFLDQRIIHLRNENGSKEVQITINPSQSRNKVTKENFDGLMELVGSIKFKE